MRLAIFELDAYGTDGVTFLQKCEAHFQVLVGRQVDLVVFPELSTMPYAAVSMNWEPRAFAISTDHEIFKQLISHATKLNTHIVFPFPELGTDGVYNSIALIKPSGECQVVYRKIHLPDGKLANEARYFRTGNLGIEPVNVDGVSIGFAVCYDRYFPEQFRFLASKGAEIVIVPCAASGSAKKSWVELGVAHAVVNRIFYVCTNRRGAESNADRPFFGESFAIDPWGGRLQAEEISAEPRTIILDVDTSEIGRARAAWPMLDQWSATWSMSLKDRTN